MSQIEGLMLDIAAAEEEITRWKVAAEQEAAAGRAVEQEFIAQVCSRILLSYLFNMKPFNFLLKMLLFIWSVEIWHAM